MHTGASDPPWKHAERQVAAIFGGVRRCLNSASRREADATDDVVHDRLYIEVKWTSKSALWSLWKLTRGKAKKKTPVVATKLKSHAGTLLTVHSDDLDSLIEERLMAMSEEECVEIEHRVARRRLAAKEGLDVDLEQAP